MRAGHGRSAAATQGAAGRGEGGLPQAQGAAGRSLAMRSYARHHLSQATATTAGARANKRGPEGD
eukprot:6308457-Alexandrium_andersonii.AAC.1